MIVTKNNVITQRVKIGRSKLKQIENDLYNDGQIKDYDLWLFISDLVNEIDAKKVEKLNSKL